MNPTLDRLASLRLPEPSLWSPGPHQLSPAVRETLAQYNAVYSHRSTDYKSCFQRATDLLVKIFDIPAGHTPIISGHTGSYVWEMAAANTPRAYRTLGMDFGAFSAKWCDVFGRLGRDVEVISAEWGSAIQLHTWLEAVRGGIDLALITHNETSTGVMLPLDHMCARAHRLKPELLLAVDSVSAAGAVPLSIRSLEPDYLFWSLQKNFAIPAIGSVLIVSDRAVDVARNTADRGYVLDLVEWVDRATGAQTPMTVPDLTLQCLIARLEEMLAEGDARFARHRRVSSMHRAWAQKYGLRVMAEEGFESMTLTAVYLPEGVEGPAFVSAVKKHLNVQLAAGYGKTKDVAFRIAAMGTTSEEETERVLEGMGIILENWQELGKPD